MLVRFQNWPIVLNRVIREAAGRPFKYGKHDCALFAADCVKAMTGTDLAADLRGRYTTKSGADHVLEEFFGGNLERAIQRIAEQYELEEVMPLYAQRGDLVLRGTPDVPALGILSGKFAVFAAPKGLAMVKVLECRRAWKV